MKKSFCLSLVFLIAFIACKDEVPEPIEDQTTLIDVQIDSLGANVYGMTAGKYYIEIDGKKSGRISSLKMNGHEFLSGKDVNATNWGSTFWSSPQSVWSWPPPPAFDDSSSVIEIKDGVIISTGQIDEKRTKLKFIKEISFNQEKEAFDITFRIINTRTSAYSMAPWQITRVPAKGLTFFPVDTNLITTPRFDYTIDKSVLWFDYTAETAQTSSKLVADGKEGWLAHYNDQYLFLHSFEDVDAADIANKEGDAELYVAPNKTYIEIEPQGKFAPIAAGDTAVWKVTWITREVTPTLNTNVLSQDLVDLAREIVK